MYRSSIIAFMTSLVLSAGLPGAATRCLAEEGPLTVGITGSAPADPKSNPAAILGSPRIQRLILDVAERPHSRSEMRAVIANEFFTLEDMVRVGLLREEEGLFRIDFNLLRQADQRRILEVSEELGSDLAAAFLARRAEFETLAAAHKQQHVGKAEVLYAVLGCFSLDWDGLALTEERGWRAGAQRTIDGASFTPWAKERGGEISLKGLYWGSHTSNGTTFNHTTFGDHHTLPRFAMPDMTWISGRAFSQYEGLRDGRFAAGQMLSDYLGDARDDVASVMRSLREHDRPAEEIASMTGIKAERLERILALLVIADYVEEKDGIYGGRVLVLASEDGEWVRKIVAMGRDVIRLWHEDNYHDLRSTFSDLTPLKNGVPFERVYTEIWHFVFAIANRDLVEAGLFADPYGEGRRHTGFLPVIWAGDLPVSVP